MSSPAADLSSLICVVRYAYIIIAPPIHIAIGYFHLYFWLIVFSAAVERCVSTIGLVPLAVDFGIVNIGVNGFSALSRESMRLLGRSDVLRFRQAVYAGIALIAGLFDLDRINGIKGVVCPLDANGPSNATELDLAPMPIDVLPINSTQPSRNWVFSTRTYIALAGLVTVPLIVYMFYLLIKQAILNSRLCKRSPADTNMQLGLLNGEMIDGKDWAAVGEVDEDGPEPTDNAVLSTPLPDAVNEASTNFVKPANLIFFKLSTLPAWLPTMPLPFSMPFSIPFISPTTEALLKITDLASSALQKSADCVVDALAPFVFGTLLMLTTATGILLYGVGHVGIAKIAESGIFGLNEDAIDTLLEMIHMQWRLMRQLKWSWWLSVAGRYESRCQYGPRQEQLGEGTGIAADSEQPEPKPEPEHERVHGHGYCTDAACPFQQLIPHNVLEADAPPVDSAQPSSVKDTKQNQKENDVDTAAVTVPHRKSPHHRLGRHHSNDPDNHIKLDTRRDWLRWLVRGKDGKGSHYRDRHQRHNVNNAPAKDKDKTGAKKVKAAKADSE